VVIAEPGREYEAAMRLGRIGFDGVAGYLANGRGAAPHLVERTERISPQDWARESAQASPPFLLDVRTASEWEQSRIDGSANIPLNSLRERIAELPPGRRIVVHCAGGYRSSIAASLLKLHGFKDVADLAGGIGAWRAAQNSRPSSETDRQDAIGTPQLAHPGT
jgi:rhodanese-related sulfurtransferase